MDGFSTRFVPAERLRRSAPPRLLDAARAYLPARDERANGRSSSAAGAQELSDLVHPHLDASSSELSSAAAASAPFIASVSGGAGWPISVSILRAHVPSSSNG